MIKELKMRLSSSNVQNLEYQVDDLRKENAELRKKLLDALQNKYQRNANKEKLKQRKLELLQSTDRILEITKKQKSFLNEVLPNFEKD